MAVLRWLCQRDFAVNLIGTWLILATSVSSALAQDTKSNLMDAAVHTARGIEYGNKGELYKAIAEFNEAIRLDPQFAYAYFYRGVSWLMKKDYDKAIADQSEVIRLNSKFGKAFYNRAIAYAAKREYEKAIADYRSAQRVDPKDASAMNNLAWLLATCPTEKLRDGKLAVELARKALETRKDRAGYMSTLAAAYAEVGQFDEAVRWQEKALEDSQLKNDADSRSRLELYRKKTPYREK